jgi:hypothetical protein
MQLVQLVSVVQHFITIHLYENQQIDEPIESATRLLGLLHEANAKCKVLSYLDFYNDAVNNDEFNIKEDYRRWKQPDRYSNRSITQLPGLLQRRRQQRRVQHQGGLPPLEAARLVLKHYKSTNVVNK